MDNNNKKEHMTIEIKRNIANRLKKMSSVGVSYNDIITDLIGYYRATKWLEYLLMRLKNIQQLQYPRIQEKNWKNFSSVKRHTIM